MQLSLESLRSDDNSTKDELASYLKENEHEGVRMRPKPEMEKAMSSGRTLIVRNSGKICGCSLIYKFEPNGDVYSEIGTMRVTMNQCGVQNFLGKIHILQILIEDYDPISHPNIFGKPSSNEKKV